ncbi:MAG: class I SAM-dependent methyltransferase [Promethearchaeota archaeon]
MKGCFIISKYVDYAEYYDFDAIFKEDIPFYLKYAEQTGGPILELACGTGRILLPFAKAGYNIYGIDLSENMLAVAKKKVTEQGLDDLVFLINTSMVNFNLEEKSFALAFIAVRSFMHLYSQNDQLSCLESIIRHLRPGGLLIIDIYSPNLEMLTQTPNSEFNERSYVLPNGHRVNRKNRFICNDLLNQINKAELCFEEFDIQGKLIRTKIVPMDTRYTFRFEKQLLLEKVGFEVLSVFSDYRKQKYNGTGEIITISRKPDFS